MAESRAAGASARRPLDVLIDTIERAIEQNKETQNETVVMWEAVFAVLADFDARLRSLEERRTPTP